MRLTSVCDEKWEGDVSSAGLPGGDLELHLAWRNHAKVSAARIFAAQLRPQFPSVVQIWGPAHNNTRKSGFLP